MSEVAMMRRPVTNFFEVENVGLIDGVLRGSLGIAIILSVLLVPAISSNLLAALTLVGTYLGLTAFLSWDPFYALAKRMRRRPSEEVCTTLTIPSVPKRVDQAIGEVTHRKAA